MIIIIIGEHIDYCGYGVFPMALEQDIVMAVSVNDDQKLRIYNTNQQFTYDNTHKYYWIASTHIRMLLLFYIALYTIRI